MVVFPESLGNGSEGNEKEKEQEYE